MLTPLRENVNVNSAATRRKESRPVPSCFRWRCGPPAFDLGAQPQFPCSWKTPAAGRSWHARWHCLYCGRGFSVVWAARSQVCGKQVSCHRLKTFYGV